VEPVTKVGRTGAVATNLRRFVGELERCDPGVVCHHAAGHDFSRWARDVLADPVLAERVLAVETAVPHDLEADACRARRRDHRPVRDAGGPELTVEPLRRSGVRVDPLGGGLDGLRRPSLRRLP
jgi:hypothetical protein